MDAGILDRGLKRIHASGPLWLGGIVSLILFLFGIQLLGTATETAAAPLEQVFSTYIAGDARALGVSWIATYALANGSVIAALSISLFQTGIISASQLFLMVASTTSNRSTNPFSGRGRCSCSSLRRRCCSAMTTRRSCGRRQMLPEDIDPDELLSRLNGHPDVPLLATTEYTTLSAAPRRAWNGIHRGSPEIALETDSEDTPVDRQSAREQVLEKLVPLLEAGLSPSQVLDY